MRILIIEDEVRLAQTLSFIISKSLAPCDMVHDGESGLEYALSGLYDAIVLDVMLPKLDGFSLLQQLRQKDRKTPVLILSARTNPMDRVYGLDSGADYYLPKPFDNSELLACLRSLLRRQDPQLSDQLQFGDLTLSSSLCRLTCNGQSISLTAKECGVLRLLLRNQNQSLSKDMILSRVWGYDTETTESHVEVYISFLRKKLSLLHSKVQIVSIRRVGYHLEAAE